jgi:hypothetical protein
VAIVSKFEYCRHSKNIRNYFGVFTVNLAIDVRLFCWKFLKSGKYHDENLINYAKMAQTGIIYKLKTPKNGRPRYST